MLALHILVFLSVKTIRICKANIIISIIGIAAGLYVWITLNPSLGSQMVFLIFINLCFFISLNARKNEENNYVNVVNWASLIMLAGVFIIVLAILTDGDGLEIMDTGWWDGTRGSEDRNNIK